MNLSSLKFASLLLLGLIMLAVPNAVGQDATDFSEGAPSFSEGESIDFSMEGFEDFGEESGPPELSDEEAAALAAASVFMFVVIGIATVFGLILTALVAYFMSDALNAVPEQYRQLSPVIPWLLFVPLINIVILFLVFIKVPESLSAYLNSVGEPSQGDCGKSKGLWGAILYILGCTFPIGLVLLIMSMMSISQAKKAARASLNAT